MNHIIAYLIKNKAVICSAGSIIGVIATAIFAHKDTKKAEKKVKEEDFPKYDKIVSKIKILKCYIRTIVSAILTISLILMTNKIYISEKTILAGIGAAWAEKSAMRNDERPSEVVRPRDSIGDGRILLYEPYSDQYIWTSKERMATAEAKANIMLQKRYSVGINYIIGILGGSKKESLKNIGWSVDDEVCDWNWSFTIGGPCIMFDPGLRVIDGQDSIFLSYEVEPTLLDREPTCDI